MCARRERQRGRGRGRGRGLVLYSVVGAGSRETFMRRNPFEDIRSVSGYEGIGIRE